MCKNIATIVRRAFKGLNEFHYCNLDLCICHRNVPIDSDNILNLIEKIFNILKVVITTVLFVYKHPIVYRVNKMTLAYRIGLELYDSL